MSALTTALAVIIVFGVLIISHELGHFLTAKLFKVYVHDFSIGLGPKILDFKRKETAYTLRLLPIGGMVRMMGEDEEDGDPDDPRSFNKKKIWQRILIIFNGPLFNFVAALIIFVISYMVIGVVVEASDTSVLGTIIPSTPADEAGLLPGDEIISINGVEVNDWSGITPAIQTWDEASGLMPLMIIRDGQQKEVLLTPSFDGERYTIGITPEYMRERLGFFQSISLGFETTYMMTVEIFKAIGMMFSGEIEPELAGPVGIVDIIGDSARSGMSYLLSLAAMLCVNVGIVNLMPLPALDGSRIVFLIIEGLRGKPINREKEGLIHFIGFALLLALVVVVTFNDIRRLLG